MLWQGVNPKWITHFPYGRYVLDTGQTDEEWWAQKDQVSMGDAESVAQELTPEELLDLRLRELGF